MSTSLASMQAQVGRWLESTFGEKIKFDVAERALRVAEEVLELCQSLELKEPQIHQLVRYVYGRRIGYPKQEVSGCMITIIAMANCLGYDLEEVVMDELNRINMPEVVERCRRRQAEKRAALVTGEHARRIVRGPTEDGLLAMNESVTLRRSVHHPMDVMLVRASSEQNLQPIYQRFTREEARVIHEGLGRYLEDQP